MCDTAETEGRFEVSATAAKTVINRLFMTTYFLSTSLAEQDPADLTGRGVVVASLMRKGTFIRTLPDLRGMNGVTPPPAQRPNKEIKSLKDLRPNPAD